MGNTASLATEEQNEAASMEAIDIFKHIDKDADGAISTEEWGQAFQALDADGNGSISRKEWYLKQGTTEMYDAIQKKSSGNLTREEWQAVFQSLDTNGDGTVSVAEWMSRRKVRIGFVPLGLTMHNWGVGIGNDFYEVLTSTSTASEMVVAGPAGLLALGPFAKEEGAKEKWAEAFKADITAGSKPDAQWLEEKGEPRARPEQIWQDKELCGWTMKTDEEVEVWIKEWVERNSEFKAMDAFGFECNDQTFATALISWLTDTAYSRWTDNSKGRAVVYGGLAVLAAAGGIYLASRMTKAPSTGNASSSRERTRTS